MAITRREVRNSRVEVNSFIWQMIDIDLDTSYPNAGGGAGGYALSPALFGFRTLLAVEIVGLTDTSVVTNLFAFNVGTGKLVVYVASTGAEVANTVSVSGQKLRLLGIGR
jgi:hypothetical protein